MAADPNPRTRSFAALLFGYDVFISFALNGQQRGSRAYASDLARRLRERDFTVFFSEDEAPVGDQLDNTLVRGLRRARALVVIANIGTLRDPRWVKTEVETFRQLHPGRPVIPINIDSALQAAARESADLEWLSYAGRIWIDETADASAAGAASDEVVQRLATAPRASRSAVRLRALTVAIGLILVSVASAAVWQAVLATQARREAEARTIEARDQRDDARRQREEADKQRAEAQTQRERAEINAERAESSATEARQQRAEAERQRDTALGALARAEAQSLEALEQHDAALQVALEAVRLAPDANSYETLHRIVSNRARPVFRTSGEVSQSMLSANGRRAVFVGSRTVTVVDLHQPSANPTVLVHPGVIAARFDASGERLALIDQAASLHVVNLPSGATQSRSLMHPPPAGGQPAPRFSDDGAWVAVVAGGTLRIVDTFGSGPVWEHQHTEQLRMALPIGPETAVVHVGARLGLMSSAGFVPVAAQRRSNLRRIAGESSGGWLSLTFAAEDEELLVWNSITGEILPGTGGRVTAAAMHPDGRRVALGFGDGGVLVRSHPQGHELARLKFKYQISALRFSADGTQLFALGIDTGGFSTVHRVDAAGWLHMGSAPVGRVGNWSVGHDGLSVDSSGDVAAVGRWALAFDRLAGTKWPGAPADLELAAADADGQRVVGRIDRRRALWLAARQPQPSMVRLDGCDLFAELALSRDGTHLAVVCAPTQDLRVFDVAKLESPRLLVTLPAPGRQGLRFAPDGRWLAIGAQRFDTHRWQPLPDPIPSFHGVPAVSKDGRRVVGARGGDGEAMLIEWRDGTAPERAWRVIDRGRTDAVALSDDQRWVAAGAAGGALRVLDLSTLRRRELLPPMAGVRFAEVSQIVFSRDARLLATATVSQQDQSFRNHVMLRVFERASGRELMRAPLSRVPVLLRFTPDGHAVSVLGGGPGLDEQRFPVDPGALQRLACARLGSLFDRARWERHFPGQPYRRSCDRLNPLATSAFE